MPTLILLTLSNLFMTTAWYWHLKGGPEVANARPLGWRYVAAFGCIMAAGGVMFIGQ
jgi:uncharacterized protein (DUF486 family)